jgi:type VI secretion system protein ImpL
VNPFLRGFYFAGVRESVIEGAAVSVVQEAAEPAFEGNATVVFGAAGSRVAQMAAPPPHVSGPRKVPEWIFLSQLFNEVVLKDRVALSASGFSSRVSLLRRLALACVMVIALIFAIGFLTSFLGNFFLLQKVKQAVADVNALRGTPGQTPNLDELTRLDTLRQQLEPLSAYYNQTVSVPWSLRWWLYSGDDFYPAARQAYFQAFHDLLFADAEKSLLRTHCRRERKSPIPPTVAISIRSRITISART